MYDFTLTSDEREKLDNKYQISSASDRNAFLDRIMRILRKSRHHLSQDYFGTVTPLGRGLTQVWLQTPPCRFSLLGNCTICNYWHGTRIHNVAERARAELTIPEQTQTLLINTCGSCLDTYEMAVDEQERILTWIAGMPVESVIFETHMLTITDQILERVRKFLPGKQIFMEIGIESMNPDVLFYCLNKPSSMTGISECLDKIHSYGMKCIMNVVLGSPFLTLREQIADAVNSIEGLLNKGADYLTLFPVNIKPNTLPYLLYHEGMYQRLSGWLLLDVLEAIDNRYLDRIDVAWYGEHAEQGVIPPFFCDQCRDKMLECFHRYNSSSSGLERERILKDIRVNVCSCSYSSACYCFDESEDRGVRIDRMYEFLSQKVLNQ